MFHPEQDESATRRTASLFWTQAVIASSLVAERDPRPIFRHAAIGCWTPSYKPISFASLILGIATLQFLEEHVGFLVTRSNDDGSPTL